MRARTLESAGAACLVVTSAQLANFGGTMIPWIGEGRRTVECAPCGPQRRRPAQGDLSEQLREIVGGSENDSAITQGAVTHRS